MANVEGRAVSGILSSVSHLHTFVENTPRRRSKVECHWKLTQAYLDLMFAWGYAQSGEAGRANELFQKGASALPESSPVHQTLLKAFAARCSEPSAVSPWTRLDIDLGPRSAFDQYIVCRLLEEVTILSRVEHWGPASERFFRRTNGEVVDDNDDLVTRILLADGENRPLEERTTLLREYLSAHNPKSSGAALLGPARRAGLEAEHLEHLRVAHRSHGADSVAAALRVRGDDEPLELAAESTGLHVRVRFRAMRLVLASLALTNRQSEAEHVAARCWQSATDSFSTNEYFCLTALATCDVLITSALRHELALGNRSFLEPERTSPQGPDAATSKADTNTVVPIGQKSSFEPVDEPEEPSLGQKLGAVGVGLRRASEVSPERSEQFLQESMRFAELEATDPTLVVPRSVSMDTSDIGVLAPLELASWLRSEIEEVLELLDDRPARASRHPHLRIRLVVSRGLVHEFERQERRIEAHKRWLARSLVSLGSSLRSIVVEKPSLPPPLALRISTFRSSHRSKWNKAWNESPIDVLVAQLLARLTEARRKLAGSQKEFPSTRFEQTAVDVDEAEALVAAVLAFSAESS
jgi:hypothetical protein